MTTIAIDGNGTVAADQQLEGAAGIDLAPAEKLFRANGDIIGIAGDYEAGLEFVDWYRNGASADNRPTMPDQFEALALKADGTLLFYGYRLVGIPMRAPAALGSGARFAMGAMLAGATAIDALAIACRLDSGSGTGISSMRLESRDHSGGGTNVRPE